MNSPVASPEDLNIVLFGGGGGGSVMAKGLQESFPDAQLSVIVPTGDHGGSTGIIRDVFGGPAVGDPSKIITELSGSAAVKAILETPRFAKGSNTNDIHRLNDALLQALPPQINANRAAAILDGAVEVGRELIEKHGKQLQGHSYRNIALTAIRLYVGDLGAAMSEMSSWAAVSPKIRLLPATNEAHDVVLIDGSNSREVEVRGEGKIDDYLVQDVDKARIRLDLGPGKRAPYATDEACQAVLDTNLVVIGPGSPLTSLAPSILPVGIPESLRKRQSEGVPIVDVANLCAEPQATPGLTLPQFVKFIGQHAIMPDFVLFNTAPLPEGKIPLTLETDMSYIESARAIGAYLLNMQHGQEKIDPNDAIAMLRTDMYHNTEVIASLIRSEVLV